MEPDLKTYIFVGVMWDNLLSGLIGGLAGSVIGAYTTLYATQKAHRNNLALEQIKSLEKTDAIISSIQDEITTIWQLYSEIGQRVLNEAIQTKTFFSMYYNITNDYFSIFHSTASEIGAITDEELRGDLIRTYALFKTQIDQFKTNNHLLAQNDDIALGREKHDPDLVKRNLAESVQRLKYIDTKAADLVAKTQAAIRAYREKIKAEIQSLKSE